MASVLSPSLAFSVFRTGEAVALFLGKRPEIYGSEEFVSRERKWQQEDNEAKAAQDEVELKMCGLPIKRF